MNLLAESATIRLDTAWSDYLNPFRSLAGGALTACIVICVIAIVLWVVVGVSQKLAHLRSDGFNKVVGVVIAASLVGSLASGVAWGANLMSSLSVTVDESTTGIDLGDLPKGLEDSTP